MENRSVQFPNRYKMVPVPGTKDIFDFFPVPGEIYAEGTPLNKANLLTDATAALLGLSASAVPNDAFSKIKTLIESNVSLANQKARIATGMYVGTGAAGPLSPCSLTLDFVPKFLVINCSTNSTMNVHAIGVFPYGIKNCPVLFDGSTQGARDTSVHVSGWGTNTVSWYAEASASGKIRLQLNDSSYEYYWVAIG